MQMNYKRQSFRALRISFKHKCENQTLFQNTKNVKQMHDLCKRRGDKKK